MKLKHHAFYLLIVIIFGATSCDNYNKVLNSNDVDLKYEKAKEYYNDGKYTKAIPLLDELISIYRGKEELQEIYYIYCYAHYGQGNYLMAAHNFKNYYEFYPNNEKAVEAMFMVGKCYAKVSPEPALDQENTKKARQAFQQFINTYPNSDRVDDANQQMRQLRRKLERKAYKAAKLYYDMEKYRAAAVSFENVLYDYPDIAEAEYIQYLIVKSRYLYAKNSVAQKQPERYEQTMKAYRTFSDKYPESQWLDEAKNLYQQSKRKIN